MKSRRLHLFALGLFAVLTLLVTWPVAARLGTYLAGGRDDLWVHQWTFWWVRQALSSGSTPFFTPFLYAPVGASLTSHNIAWFNIALWLPLQQLFGHIAAYNIVFLLVIILNGFCQYLFAWEEIRSFGAALVSGIIVGFWPYTLSHYDHANMMVVFWVPVTLLLVRRSLLRGASPESERGDVPWGLVVAAGFSLAMIGITRWQLLLMSSPILVGYTLYLLWQYPVLRRRQTAYRLAFLLALAFLMMAPLLAPLVRDQFTRQFPGDILLDEALWGRTDLLAYFVPSIQSGIWQDAVAKYYENFVVNQFYTPFLGYITVFLSAIGALRRWRQTWLWMVLAFLYMVFALGPELAINGRSFPDLFLPYSLVEENFLFRLIRRPDRLNLFLSLPIAMLAGWGHQVILARIGNESARRGWRAAVTVIVVAILLLFYAPVPFATTQPVTPSWYSQAAGENETFTILDLPVNDRSYDKWYMMYQIEHGLPLATGHVSRLPRDATAFLDSVPLVADLAERDQLPDPRLNDIGHQLRLLADGGIRYLIIHKQFANEGLQAAWRDWLAVEPYYEDDELIVYKTAVQQGADFHFQHVLTDDIGLVDVKIAPLTANQRGVLKVHAVWGTARALARPLELCMALISAARDENGRFCQLVSTRWPVEFWEANDLYRLSHAMPISDAIEPGVYDLAAYLVDEVTGEPVGQTAILGEVEVEPFAPQIEADAVWEDRYRLHGATLAGVDTALAVTLYWEALQPPANSLKVFVHLVDSDSGEIVAQSDSIPRDWSYPTSEWEPFEIVRDRHIFGLEALPAGEFKVQVGLYDEQSGQRLAVYDGAGQTFSDSLELGTWGH